MDDKQAMHAMSIDDAYHVERTLCLLYTSPSPRDTR